MKPKEKKPETVYRIIDRKDGEPVGSYSMEFLDREFKKIIYGLHKDGYINFNPNGKRRTT